MQHRLVIAFEGLDGTGKTKFSKIVSEELGAIGVDNSLWPIDSFGKITTEESSSPDLSFKYYVNSLISRVSLDSGNLLLFDRYVPTALGYLYLRKKLEINSKIKSEIRTIYLKLAKPDLVFVLNTPESIRLQRISKREVTDNYDLLSMDEESVKFWNYFYKEVSDSTYVFIDTSRSERSVIEDIKRNIFNKLYCFRFNKSNSIGLSCNLNFP
jgi:thymidylate kinase